MKKMTREELILLDEILGYAQMSGYVDFSNYDYIVDNISENEVEERTSKDIQIIRDKIKRYIMNRFERVDKLLTVMTTKQLFVALINAMSDDEANEILDNIVRMYDINEELL